MPRIPSLWKLVSRCLAVMGIAASLLAGCTGFKPSPGVAPTPLPQGAILFEDDFSDVPSGWGIWNRKGGVVTYEQSGLRVLVTDPNFDYWSVAGKHFDNLVLDVDATLLAGAADNDFGLICRYQDNHNFYMFLVSSDGYYGIVKLKDDQHSLIGTKQLQYSGRIKPDQTSHHLRAECVDDRLSWSVDGEKLLEAHDSDFKNGDVELLAGAYASAGVDVLFDNFKVSQP